MIYFIRAGQTPWIKIGYAKNVKARLEVLQCGNHEVCTIEAAIEGTRSDETRLHGFCRGSGYRGEWFKASGPTLIALNLAKAGAAIDRIFSDLKRARLIEACLREERTARGVLTNRIRLSTDPTTDPFHARWLRMFGIPAARDHSDEERKRLIRRLAELEGL